MIMRAPARLGRTTELLLLMLLRTCQYQS